MRSLPIIGPRWWRSDTRSTGVGGQNPRSATGTMRLLACEDTSAAHLGREFGVTMARAVAGEMPRSSDQLAWRRARDIVYATAVRLWWLLRGLRQLHKARSADGGKDERVRDALARAFPVSMPSRVSDPQPSRPREVASPEAGPALRRAGARLLHLQDEDGAWEGEMVWCPMLTAQYVLLHHIMERPLEPGRRRRVLRSFGTDPSRRGLMGFTRTRTTLPVCHHPGVRRDEITRYRAG